MAQSSACRSPYQNPHNGKEELTGGTPTKGSNYCTSAPAATRAFTPAAAPVIAPFAASGPANNFVVRYLKDDLQRIFRTNLNSRPPVPVPAPAVAAILQYEGSRERPLKARFSDIYWGKIYLKYYNFF